MSNKLEKLKNSIKQEFVKNFELNLMKTSGFIPVDKRQDEFFVIINRESLANKAQIENIVREKFNDLAPRFLLVESSEFDDLFDTISEGVVNNVASNKDIDQKVETSEEPSAEEMLVSIGWLTQDQLNECQKLARNRNVPLDAIFYEKEYLSYESIVSYLKKKFGCEVIS